jgi:dihydrodipicolinate synthase/N-acetylneuraminate lyase
MGTGVAGLLLMPPYYFRYTGGQIAEFYRQFAKEVDGKARVYLYNIPQFTNAIPPEVVEKLLASGAFAGIKDSSGDWELFERLLALKANHPFQLLVGLERAIVAKQDERADESHAHLQEFLDWIDRFPATIGVKIAACARGWKLAHTAMPYDEQTLRAKQEFEQWFKEWLPLVL